MLDLKSSKQSEKNSLFPYASQIPPEMMNAMAFQKMVPLIMEEMCNRQNGIIVEPDTVGTDFFCLMNFRTAEMTRDFVAIEQDFMKHCGNRLDELTAVAWYDEAYIGITKPIESMYSHVLRLIFNGAKIGDEYCVELLKNLYKTYHKKEYKQLKIFRKLSLEDVANIASDFKDENEDCVIGRIISMAPFFGISFDDGFNVVYKIFEDKMNACLNIVDKTIECDEVAEETYRESAGIVDQWIQESNKDESLVKKYLELSEFINYVFRDNGFENQYDKVCIDKFEGGRHHLTMTLAMLKTMYPEREFTYDEVQVCSRVRDLAIALTDVAYSVDLGATYLFGEQIDDEVANTFKFNGVSLKTSVNTESKKHQVVKNEIDVSREDISKEEYVAEIESLRANLKRCKQDISNLKNENKKLKKDATAAQSLLGEYESQRDELIKLRNYAFCTANEEELPESKNLKNMEAVIAQKHILIIGGHPNWHMKLKERFPEWKCISVEKFAALDPKITSSYERVYFFTKFISHSEYEKFVSYMNKNDIRYGYIGSINLESVIEDIYRDIK